MQIADILAPDRVSVGQIPTSKKKMLEALAELLAKGAPGMAAADILASLSAREKLGSTGLGHGVAIPHGRIQGIDYSIGAFLRLVQPLDYDAYDTQPVDLVFGLLVPQDATEVHLKHLAAIAEMFSNAAFCRELREPQADETVLFKRINGYTLTA